MPSVDRALRVAHDKVYKVIKCLVIYFQSECIKSIS